MVTSSKIEEIKRQRQKEIRAKKNQRKYFYIAAFISLIIFGYFINNNKLYAFTWIIGIAIGIIMQRSRFCFAASFRDPIMVGTTSLFRAVLLGLMISTIGFGIYQYMFFSNVENYSIMDIPGQIYPVGIHTIIGAIMFGIGMVIAGGCATGTLIRIGEGYLMQFIVLIGFIIGATLGGKSFEFWDKLFISTSKIIYLPEYIGLIPTIIAQLIVLGIIYYLAILYDKKNNIMSGL
ncbi:MAG TPA: YeeE/YedE family protein [Tissierellaceae bacterium]